MTMQISWRIEPADPRTAPDEVLHAVAVHREAIRAERLPLDPPWHVPQLVTEMRHVQGDERVMHFNAWEGERVVGHIAVFVPLKDNTHLAFVDLSVLASHRRQGLGSTLLREAVTVAREHQRVKLITNTNDRLPSGEAFANALGAQAALAMHTNQLDLTELDRALLDDWVTRAEERAGEYRVWLNAGLYPEARLEDIASIWNVMNTAPRGDLDMQDWQVTPERLRDWQAQMTATGEQRLSAFAEHLPSGQLVGLSELFWQPVRDSLLFQGATCVHPEHRRHGLGRWIKAANLRAALQANPRAQFVRTGNADSNEGMLAINHALGFKAFMAVTDWQIDVEQLQAKLTG